VDVGLRERRQGRGIWLRSAFARYRILRYHGLAQSEGTRVQEASILDESLLSNALFSGRVAFDFGSSQRLWVGIGMDLSHYRMGSLDLAPVRI